MPFSRRFALVFLAGFFSLNLTSPAGASPDLNEDVLVRNNDSRESHDQRLLAELARERTKAALNQANLTYDIKVRAHNRGAITEADLLYSHINVVTAAQADQRAIYSITHQTIDEKVGILRSSWQDGSRTRVLSDLAKLYVELREHYVVLSTELLKNTTDLAQDRQKIFLIKQELVRNHTISQEEFNEAVVLNDAAKEDLRIATTQLADANKAVADAKRDLADVTP
jgi:hypothetical protein